MEMFLPHISAKHMIVTAEVIAAVCLDVIFGEPHIAHPLVSFGHFARGVENLIMDRVAGFTSRNAAGTDNRILVNSLGIVSLLFVILPPVALILLLQKNCGFIVSVAALYLAIGNRSLAEHALAVENELASGSLAGARAMVARIVSRDTEEMEEADVARATIESVLENGNDAIFAAIFWFTLMGPAGVVLYRLVNTLDAMWGYKTERYIHFGWAAARLDDILNWVPARITAFTYAVAGHFRPALRCWRTQARMWYSPNAGPVMSSGAGALALSLGGAAKYHGRIKARPRLGEGPAPVAIDIRRSVALVQRGLLLWIFSIFILSLMREVFAI